MKTAYLNKEGIKQELKVWLPATKLLEKSNKESAIKEYKKMVSFYPIHEEVYDRLMILFRQLKDPQEELRWIDKAIRTFERLFAKSARSSNSKITSLSRSILLSTGLGDKKGKPLYQPPPIDRWQKRKGLLTTRMARSR